MKKDAQNKPQPQKRGSNKQSPKNEANIPPVEDNVTEAIPDDVVVDLDAKSEADSSLPIQGLGDVIKRVADILGFKTCSECEERRKRFNRKYKFVTPLRDLTEEEIEILERVNTHRSATGKEISSLFKTYNEVFGQKLQGCNCSGTLHRIVEVLSMWNDESKENKNKA